MPGGAGNLRDWLKRAKDAGASIHLNRRGETVVSGAGARATLKTTRKDAARRLHTIVRRLERQNGETA